jgi:hypothetical protein
MRIDRSHRPWALASFAIFTVALAGYVACALTGRPSGGSLPGLLYGIAGYGMMLFAALLGVRKKVPVWRVGRAQTWMRGHIWLGLLTLPMILFHSGFSVRGPLAWALMVLLVLVFLSGVVGAAIQHFVPSMVTSLVPLETIYEEIPHVREQLCAEADKLVRVLFTQPGISGTGAATDSEEMIELESEDREYVGNLYRQTILPFLRDPAGAGSVLADAGRSASFFEALRRKLPAPAHGVIADLESICEEERQLTRQQRLYVWLHGWLLVHVPLSIALILLGAVHAGVAWRY